MKAVKGDLKKWNVEAFGHVETRKNILWNELQELDVLAEVRPLSLEERDQRTLTEAEIERTILMEEICWRQKFRASWLKDGGLKHKVLS